MRTLSCTRCWSALRTDELVAGGQLDCHTCGSRLELHLFPALVREEQPAEVGARTLSDEEASCFYHARRQAEVACDACGRFLCRLCDVRIGERRLCPSCLEAKGAEAGGGLERRRMLYDRVALSLAVLPMLIFYLTLLTAPAVLFICFRYHKAPRSIAGGGGWRFLLAGTVAAAQLVGWVALAVVLVLSLEQILG